MDDPYNLQRFVEAQEPIYARVLAELRAGNKRSHWMWFVFPQIAGWGTVRRRAASRFPRARRRRRIWNTRSSAPA